MLKLRTFRDSDADVIIGWIPDEIALRMWSADRYGDYPIRAEDIRDQYAGHENSDTLFPLTMEDEMGVVGHLIMRFPGEDRQTIRLGFVIVNDKRRGEGYGRKLLQLAIQYAVDMFGVDRITLGVFAENKPARRCYERVGFREVPMEEYEYYRIMGENWKCLEMELEV
jgi:RimJ/RimL family protein N-acetyltransferase